MLYFVSSAVLLGLSAGLAPGPLLTLVISESLRHGASAGVRTAFAPLVTDLPIIVLAWFVLSRLAHSDAILGVVSAVGAVAVMYLALESFRVTEIVTASTGEPARSLHKGVLVNFLNPQPYLFWVSIGVPIMLQAADYGIWPPLVFLLIFYSLLVGLKVVLALLVGRSRSRFNLSTYRFVMRFLGVMLVIFSLSLLWDAVTLFSSAEQ